MLIADYMDETAWHVDVISGPQTDSEGSLIEEVRRRGVPLTIEPSLVREVNPLKDIVALIRLTRYIKRGNYAIVHTQFRRRVFWVVGRPGWPERRSLSIRFTVGRITSSSIHWCEVFTFGLKK